MPTILRKPIADSAARAQAPSRHLTRALGGRLMPVGRTRLAMLPLALMTLSGGVIGMGAEAAADRMPIVEVQTEAETALTSPEVETTPEVEAGTGTEGDNTAETGTDTDADADAEELAALTGPMTVTRAGELFTRLDNDAQIGGGGRFAQFIIDGTELVFVSDPVHNRMRLMSRIGPAEALTAEQLMRIAQANFDTALDARYAVAQGQLWSVYIHPLAELTESQLIEAVGQVVNAASSFGTSYSSGLLSFGGGDAAAAQRALIDDLLKRGEPI